MDSSESLAHAYLVHSGLTPVVFEPDGNIPPDFVVAGQTAVEVRRLNQHDASIDPPRGLEYDEFPLLTGMRSLLPSLGPRGEGPSWFVMYSYGRPVALWRQLEPLVRDVLERFRAGAFEVGADIDVTDTFSIRLHKASTPLDHQFELGGYSDHDSGGWLLSEVKRNIEICAGEKSRKIARYRHRYDTWWLLLVDHISYAMSELERELFRANITINHDWDKIILVDPRDPTRAVEIGRSGSAI